MVSGGESMEGQCSDCIYYIAHTDDEEHRDCGYCVYHAPAPVPNNTPHDCCVRWPLVKDTDICAKFASV